MSAMISATMMTKGMNPVVAIIVTIVLALVVGVVNGYLVGKFKLPPFIATLGTMFIARGIAYIVNNNRNTDNIASGIGKKPETDSRIFSTMERHRNLQYILDRTYYFPYFLVFPCKNQIRTSYLCNRF